MLRRLKIEEGWFTLFLVWGLVIVAAAAILSAELIDGMELLPLITTLAVLAGLALSKSRFSGRTAHLMAIIYGMFLVTFLLGRTLPGDLSWRERIIDLAGRQVIWLTKAVSQGSSRDGLIFVIHTSAVFWLLGYTATWYTFRRPRMWRVVLPSGLVLLSVIYYYYGPKPLVGFLALYALIALIYIARTHLVAEELNWRQASVRYEKGIRFSFLQASFLTALVALALAWGLPTVQASSAVSNALGETGASGVWHDFQDNWTRLFASLRSYGAGTSDPYRGSLSLGGPRSVTNSLIMDVYVEERIPYVYWQAVAYDKYQDGGWSISEGDPVLYLPDEGGIDTADYRLRQDVSQTFVNFIPNSGTLYGAPELINSDRQMIVTQSRDGEGKPVVHTVSSRYIMRQGERYEITSSYSSADATSLRQASQSYPAWVTEKYLQVPLEITPETIALAEELTAPYQNPFDKAISVRDYLRQNITYNDQIDAPPEGIEPVHYILFEKQQAYCNYYASAMIMMLRSQGIPSRFVAGYAQGEWDDESSSYRVRAINAHAWVEVFFPEYGWIQFEPTAAIPAGDRPEEGGNPGDAFGNSSIPDDTERLPEDIDVGLQDGTENVENTPEENAAGEQGFAFSPLTLLQALGAAAILGLAILTTLLVTRSNRKVESSVEKSYLRLGTWAPWVGVLIRPSHTPYERANLLSGSVPEGKVPLRNLTHQYVRSQFSPLQAAEKDFDPRQEWKILRPLMIRRSIVRQIERARERFKRADKKQR